jgi:hypothetical protein
MEVNNTAQAKFALHLISQTISTIDFLKWSHDIGIKTELLFSRLSGVFPAREELGGEMLVGSVLGFTQSNSETSWTSSMVCIFVY